MPGRFFKAGPGGYDSIQSFRRAAGDDGALVSLQDYAVGQLRNAATRADGTLDPVRFAAWRTAHVDALRAFPELIKRLSTAERASRLLDEARLFPDGAPDSTIAARVFKPGAQGYEAATKFLQAVGEPRAASVVQDYAISTLRRAAETPEGILDPAKVAQWRQKHADALRAFPEINRMLADPVKASETMAAAAEARKAALDNFQTDAIGKLLKVDDPSDVTRTVGSIFGRQDATKQMAMLVYETRAKLQAKEGLRKAVADYITGRFVSNTEAGTSGNALLKADQFQTFVRQNKAALRTVLTGDELNTLQAVAADLQRANRSITAVKLPGGSNTAQDLTALARADKQPTLFSRAAVAIANGGTGALAGMAFGGMGAPIGALVGAVGGEAVMAMRKEGLRTIDDLVKDAMLNPARARLLLEKVPATSGALTRQQSINFAQRFRRTAVLGAGSGEQ